jgi:NADH-quinone oxidoreductase subunit A
VAAGLGVLLLVLGFLIGQGQKDAEKLSPYECGFEAFDDSRMKFDVRYYLVAIRKFGLISMALFLAILVVGFIYEWKKGALEWD